MSDKIIKLFPQEDHEIVKKYIEMWLPGETRHKYQGYNIIPGLYPDTIEYLYNEWKIRSSDVFLASYPKTGTLWTLEILRLMLFQGKEEDEITNQFPMPFNFFEFGERDKFYLLDKLPFKRRLMFTHLPAGLVNVDKIRNANAKVVYTIRNPKDEMVSMLHFFSQVPAAQNEPMKSIFNSGWDNYFENVIAGNVEMHSKPGEWYPEHIASWYKHLDMKTVYFIYYEDLVKNTFEEVKKLAEFLDMPLSDEKMRQIVDKTTFKKMKKSNQKLETEAMKWFRDTNLRKGGVGGWKDYFTVSQSERLDAIMEEKFKDTSVKFTYEL